MMKKVIDGKVYNTETATEIASKWNGLSGSDFNRLAETIYETKKGRYFLHGVGGAATKYATMHMGWSSCGEDIIPLTKQDLYEYLEAWQEVELIEKLFADKIEEA